MKLNKIFYTFFIISLFITLSCFDNKTKKSLYGSLGIKIIWMNQKSGSINKIRNQRVLPVTPQNVYKITGVISASDMETVNFSFETIPGENGSGDINNIPAGNNRMITIEGKNKEELTLYKGTAGPFTVSAGVINEINITLLPDVTDITPPTVLYTIPSDKAIDISLDTSITITFSEEMNPDTINTDTFLVNNGVDYISGIITYTGATATFTPLSNLEYNTQYIVTITTEVTDLSGNAIANEYIWIFDTQINGAINYGGIATDSASSIQLTSDSGYIIAGTTSSFGAGNSDFWVQKFNSYGEITWQKTYGGIDNDDALSIQQTIEGGYIIAGNTYSFGTASSNFWVLKLNSNGEIVWQKAFGMANSDYAFTYSIQQTIDGGYIVTGFTTNSFSYSYDFWVLKLDSNGTITWQKIYDGADEDYGYSIQQTTDSGYIVAGDTYSFGVSMSDIWVLKLNSEGAIIWEKTYGGANNDNAYSIQQTSDGGYIVAGYTKSFGAGNYDIWILKLNANGTILWQKTFGGADDDKVAYSIQQTSDGGYIVAGYTKSFGAGNYDIWILKLNVNGTILWQKTFGGLYNDAAYSIQQTNDDGYIIAGQTNSFGAGNYDIWILKISANGEIIFNPLSGASASNTNAIVTNTSVIGKDTNAAIVNTSVIGIDSNAIIKDTNVEINQQSP